MPQREKSETLGRREFVRRAAMASAAAAVAAPLSAAAAQDPAGGPVGGQTDALGVTWQKAPCRFCGTGCHVLVGVKGQRVVGIAGDRQAAVNRGLLCVKGYHVGLALYGKDRLTAPLLRRGGAQVPISWGEALDLLARRIAARPGGLAFYGSGQWTIPEGYAAQKLMKAGLSNNHIDPNARLCMASAVTGFLATYGVDEPAGCYDDLDRCDVLIMWGNNPAEMHPVLFSRVIDRRARGEQVLLVDIGTRRTRTTQHCQRFLRFRPHTDLAIANGVAHLLLQRDAYHKSFVSKYCAFRADSSPPTLQGQAITLEAYRQQLAPYTPERVEQISGVPAQEIRALAELFGRQDLRITSLWCMGMNQHTRGTAINTLVHGIHLLSGHFGRPGDAPTSLTGQPSACGTVREVGTLAHALPGGRVVTDAAHRASAEKLWNLPPGRLNPKPGYHTVEMWRRFCTPASAGGDIHTIWVQVTNPGQTLPNLGQLFDAREKVADKFLVVSDVYPTATTRAADAALGDVGGEERHLRQLRAEDPAVVPHGAAARGGPRRRLADHRRGAPALRAGPAGHEGRRRPLPLRGQGRPGRGGAGLAVAALL